MLFFRLSLSSLSSRLTHFLFRVSLQDFKMYLLRKGFHTLGWFVLLPINVEHHNKLHALQKMQMRLLSKGFHLPNRIPLYLYFSMFLYILNRENLCNVTHLNLI